MKAVIFDKDGVILDSEKTNLSSAVKAFSILGIEVEDEETSLIEGKHPDAYVEYFSGKHSFSIPEFRKIQRETYFELLDYSSVFDNVISLIKILYEKKFPQAVVTSSGRDSTHLILEKLGVKKYFDTITTRDDTSRHKPDPEPYLVTAKVLKVDPSDCVVFEDSAVGIRAALSAGMRCVAMRNEYTSDEERVGCCLVIDRTTEIDMGVLRTLFKS